MDWCNAVLLHRNCIHARSAAARSRRAKVLTSMSTSRRAFVWPSTSSSSTSIRPLPRSPSSSSLPRIAAASSSSGLSGDPGRNKDRQGGTTTQNSDDEERRRQTQHQNVETTQLPRLDALVVVEGPSDARAVSRAVRCRTHSLGGATWARNKGAMDLLLAEAEKAATRGSSVVLLLDPDGPGRVARGEISRMLLGERKKKKKEEAGPPPSSPPTPPVPISLFHAFIPPSRATAGRAVGGKSEGDVGVEHASPAAVVASLRSARKHRGSVVGSSPSSALSLFSMRELEEARLATSFDAGSQQEEQKKKKEEESGGEETTPTPSSSLSQKTSDRRRRFCDALGLGPCTGAQLLRALNEWGLTKEDWEFGMRAAEGGRGGGGG